jgi:hypothetical protein
MKNKRGPYLQILSTTGILFIIGLLLVPWKIIIENEIKDQLSKKNIKVESLKIAKIGMSGIIVEDFNINGGALEFKKLKVSITIDSLLNKSIENIQLDGFKINKEKLEKSFKNEDASSKQNTNKINLEQMVKKIPTNTIDFNLSSLNGIHPELKLGNFPTNIKFNKSKNEFRVKVEKGHIKAFKKIEDILVNTEFIFNVFKNHIELNLKYFRLNLPGLMLKTASQAKIKIDLDNKNNLTLDQLSTDFDLNVKFESDKPYLSELDVKNKVSLVDNKYLIESWMSHPSGSIQLFVEGTLDSKNSNVGLFNIDLKIKDLTEKNLKKTSPVLASHLKELQGTLGMNGQIILSKKGMIPKLNINGNEINFQYEEAKINGLNFKHHLSSLKSYGSKKLNTISIDQIDMGLIIKDIKTSYRVKNPKKIYIENLSLKTFDGLVQAENFSIINNLPTDLVIKLKKIPLNKLLNMALKDGVEATGEIEGTLPIAFLNNKPIIKNGRLKNSGKGFIKYNPNKANPLKSMNQMQVNILLNYLKDFTYKKLFIDANSDKMYNLVLNSHFMGTNPDAYQGRPLKLGINLDFNIKNAILSKMMFMKIPEKIEERLIKEMEK